MNHIPPGGVPLNRLGQVPIASMEVFPAASVEVVEGGLSLPGMDVHLRIVKLPEGRAVLVPCGIEFLRKLADRIEILVGQHEQSKQQKEHQ